MTQPTSCLGAPAGFESPCGEYPSPHGPHGPVAAADVDAEEREQVRARQVAAIHALAEWYAEHPDVPMPDHVYGATYTYGHNGPEADRVMTVLDFARATGANVVETWDNVKARHDLIDQDGMSVWIVQSAALVPVSAHRYVP